MRLEDLGIPSISAMNEEERKSFFFELRNRRREPRPVKIKATIKKLAKGKAKQAKLFTEAEILASLTPEMREKLIEAIKKGGIKK